MKKPSEESRIIKIRSPIAEQEIQRLKIGDKVEVSGVIYCGRDAVLPKIVRLIERNALDSINVNLRGAVIFHTAVSIAGIGPTTSNKVEIEGSISALSKAGVKIHLGKGSLSPDTAEVLKQYNSVFAITPPVSALFSYKIISQRLAAFKEEGMEAFYELEVKEIPAIIAIARGHTIF
jgi:fumarate hydratase subunit beta